MNENATCKTLLARIDSIEIIETQDERMRKQVEFVVVIVVLKTLRIVECLRRIAVLISVFVR